MHQFAWAELKRGRVLRRANKWESLYWPHWHHAAASKAASRVYELCLYVMEWLVYVFYIPLSHQAGILLFRAGLLLSVLFNREHVFMLPRQKGLLFVQPDWAFK